MTWTGVVNGRGTMAVRPSRPGEGSDEMEISRAVILCVCSVSAT